MITSIFVNVPCPCGRAHRLPAPPTGLICWLCGTTRTYLTLRLKPGSFQRLLANSPSEQQLASEGVCTLHRAGEPNEDQQRCEQCGWLLISYRAFLRAAPWARRDVRFWPVGVAVGRSIDGSYYLAHLPPSPHRERVCFLPAGVS